jgi:hypothetical protein
LPSTDGSAADEPAGFGVPVELVEPDDVDVPLPVSSVDFGVVSVPSASFGGVLGLLDPSAAALVRNS